MGYYDELDTRVRERGAKPGTLRYLHVARRLEREDCQQAFSWPCRVCPLRCKSVCPRRKPLGGRH